MKRYNTLAASLLMLLLLASVASGRAAHTATIDWRTEARNGELDLLSFAPDGETLWARYENNGLMEWDLASNQPVRTLFALNRLTDFTFSSNGQTIITGDVAGTIGIWNVASGELSNSISVGNPANTVYSVAISPDGTKIAAGYGDAMVRVWNAADGSLLLSLAGHTGAFAGHTGRVSDIAFTSDGSKIVSGSYDATVVVWDANTGDLVHTLEGSTGSIYGVTISPDGSQIAATGKNGIANVWNSSTGVLTLSLATDDAVTRSIAFVLNGTRLVTGGETANALKFWDPTSGDLTRVLRYDEALPYFAVSPDDASIAVSRSGGQVEMWEPNGTHIGMLALLRHPTNAVFTADDAYVITTGIDGYVRKWDASTGSLLDTLYYQGGFTWPTSDAHSKNIVISLDGSLLVTGSTNGTIKVWDIQNDQLLYTFTGAGNVYCLAISPTGKTLASGSASDLRIWGLRPEFHLHALNGNWGGITSLAFSPDGETLVSGGVDRRIFAWDWKEGTSKLYIRDFYYISGHGHVSGLAFSATGDTLVGSCYGDPAETAVRMWDMRSGSQIGMFPTELSGDINGVELSSDNKAVLARSKSGVDVWNLSDGSRIGTYTSTTYHDLNSTGTAAISASVDGLIHNVYSLPFWKKIDSTPTAIAASSTLPDRPVLSAASPNPFNPRTALRFSIPEAGAVRLAIYDVNGRPVATLVNRMLPAGHHEFVWNGVDDTGHAVGSGVYVSRLEGDGWSEARRMTLVR